MSYYVEVDLGPGPGTEESPLFGTETEARQWWYDEYGQFQDPESVGMWPKAWVHSNDEDEADAIENERVF